MMGRKGLFTFMKLHLGKIKLTCVMKYKASPSTHAGTHACKHAGLVGYIHGKYHISRL